MQTQTKLAMENMDLLFYAKSVSLLHYWWLVKS